MKSKLNRILLIILIVWFLVFMVDMVCIILKAKPIFVIPAYGGEVTEYIGLGYTAKYYYPMSSLDNRIESSSSVNPSIYIIVNIVAITFLIVSSIIKRRKTKDQ